MAIPLMTIVAAVRNELSLTARGTADSIGITHGFLQQTEEFEYVPPSVYRTAKGKPIEHMIKYFFADHLSDLRTPLLEVVESVIPFVTNTLNNDRKFHTLANSDAFAAIYVPASGITPYGPLFNFVVNIFFEKTNKGIFLTKTGDVTVDYFLDFIMSRFWGHRAAQKRRHARTAGFVYESMLMDSRDTGHVGFFESCKDPREILWLRSNYAARRNFLPYLLLYLLTTGLYFSLSKPILSRDRNCPTQPFTRTGILANYPARCAEFNEATCFSPCTCNVVALLCPGNNLVNFYYRPERDGLFDYYCVQYAKSEPCSC